VALTHFRIAPVVLLWSSVCVGDGEWVFAGSTHEGQAVQESTCSNGWRVTLLIF
jgi:hypothetical protein